MNGSNDGGTGLVELARELGATFGERAGMHDREGLFVAEDYTDLRRHRIFSAAVPRELGGRGAGHAELCAMLRELGRSSTSTALALSMHTHLAATQVFRWKNGQPAEAILRRIAAEELVLVSTGAGDWVDSVGSAERVEGGFRVSGTKRFASGAPAGDLLMTSAPLVDAADGPQVIHFAVPMRAPGVQLLDDWHTLGMRGTGSNSVVLTDVFVPEGAVSLRRPRGAWHPFWNVVVTVAAPLYLAPYVGLVERAAELAIEAARGRAAGPTTHHALGELENARTIVGMAFREMIELTDEYGFRPTDERASRMLARKSIAVRAMDAVMAKSVELVGGRALFRRDPLERLFRDLQGARFHPLPEAQQLVFSGRVLAGLSPIEPDVAR